MKNFVINDQYNVLLIDDPGIYSTILLARYYLPIINSDAFALYCYLYSESYNKDELNTKFSRLTSNLKVSLNTLIDLLERLEGYKLLKTTYDDKNNKYVFGLSAPLKYEEFNQMFRDDIEENIKQEEIQTSSLLHTNTYKLDELNNISSTYAELATKKVTYRKKTEKKLKFDVKKFLKTIDHIYLDQNSISSNDILEIENLVEKLDATKEQLYDAIIAMLTPQFDMKKFTKKLKSQTMKFDIKMAKEEALKQHPLIYLKYRNDGKNVISDESVLIKVLENHKDDGISNEIYNKVLEFIFDYNKKDYITENMVERLLGIIITSKTGDPSKIIKKLQNTFDYNKKDKQQADDDLDLIEIDQEEINKILLELSKENNDE